MKKIFIKKCHWFLFGIFLMLISSITAQAMTIPSSSNYDLELTLNPKNPSAQQTITAQIELYGLDIEKFEILWFVDGVLKKKGIGQKEFFFQTKDWGEVTTLTVQVNTTKNGQLTKSVKLTPAEVDLIWEADTTVPPFYKGKALNSSNAVLKIVALPNFIDQTGEKIPSENLIYTWKENSRTKGSQSGYGKNVYTCEGPQTGRSKRISVTVTSLNGNIQSQQAINLRARNPQIIFYKQDPLLGTLYNQAIISGTNLNQEELKVMATPFFFSPQDELKYKWTLNGQILNKNDLEITLRKPDNQAGTSKISLKINNLETILQFTESGFTINFGK